MGSGKYIGRWFHVPCNGVLLRAKCIDIEFESTVGPIFLFESEEGFKFWVTRSEWKIRETC